MLRHVYVDGYRSLIDFNITLSSGLNVIVGPNGTGKSNFISFLDFSGELLIAGLNAAIATTQGAGSVFSQEKFSQQAAELTFVFNGRTNTDRVYNPWLVTNDPENNQSGEYSYECRIRYDRAIPAIYIGYERLSIHIDNIEPYSISRTTERRGDAFHTDVVMSSTRHPIANRMFRWIKRDKYFDISQYLASILSADTSMLNRLGTDTTFIAAVLTDISSFRSINIEPSLARKPAAVGTSTRIQPTGEGLAAVLYRLERGTYTPHASNSPFRAPRGTDLQKRDFLSIMSWCREVNPHIQKAEVRLDFHEALLRPVMVFDFDGKRSEFPFRRISDGTVKWLALVTILISEETLSVIEEPENFLHPLMQEAFIGLCRQVLSADENRSIIISTHSPTLLDCCTPDELSIFDLQGGRTTSSRAENEKELSDTISNSRFGLGHFYRTGGIYGTDSSIR